MRVIQRLSKKLLTFVTLHKNHVADSKPEGLDYYRENREPEEKTRVTIIVDKKVANNIKN